MLKTVKKYYLWISVLAVFFGCADENKNLVNPPLPSETDYIRFYNFAADGKPRKLVVGGLAETDEVPAGGLSLPIKPPPADSVTLDSKLNNSVEYSSARRTRLIRNTRYVVFGASQIYNKNALDTFVVLTTSFSILRNANNCFLTMVNMNNDSTALYSLAIGCPNSPAIIQQIPYLGLSYQIEIPSGNVAVSIIKRKDSVTSLVGLYNLNMLPGGEYSIIMLNNGGTDQALMLNQKDDSQNALQPIPLIDQRVAYFRVANLSNSQIDITKHPSEIVAQGLNSKAISDYKTISACNSESLDSIIVNTGGIFSSSILASLSVNDNYTLFVFDSAGVSGRKSILVEPKRIYNSLKDSCMVRVIHAADKRNALTLSLGARDDSKASIGFRSGDILAKDLVYGRISEPVFLPAGRAPMTLFTSTQPSNLVASAIGDFKSGGKYIVAITSNSQGEDEINVIEDNDVNAQNIKPIDQGVFTQFVFFTPGVASARVQIPGILSDAKLYYEGSLATVMPLGSNSVNINGANFNFVSDSQNRDLIIAAGDATATDIFSVKSPPMEYDNFSNKKRCVNACKSEKFISVYTDKEQLNKIAEGVEYGKTQNNPFYTIGTLERKTSLYFFNTEANALIIRIPDISLIFGKNYSIIFGGNIDSYSSIILQEY